MAHIILRGVKIDNLFIDSLPCLSQQLHVRHAIAVGTDAVAADNDRFYFFIPQDTPLTSSRGLLDADVITFRIVITDIQPAHRYVIRRLTG